MCRCSSSRSSSRPCCRPWTPAWWCSSKRWRRSSRLQPLPTVSTPWSRESPLSTRCCSESATRRLSVAKIRNVKYHPVVVQKLLGPFDFGNDSERSEESKKETSSSQLWVLVHLSGRAFARRTTSAVANVASAYRFQAHGVGAHQQLPLSPAGGAAPAAEPGADSEAAFGAPTEGCCSRHVAQMCFLQRLCAWTCAWTAYQWWIACSKTKSHISTRSRGDCKEFT